MNTLSSCISITEPLGSAFDQQIGGKESSVIALSVLDVRDEGMSGGCGDLIELASQQGGRRFGIKPRGGDVLVAEEALDVGDVHAKRQQLRRHRVAQEMRINALRHVDGAGDLTYDLPNPLTGVDMRRRPGALLPALEQRPSAAGADMQLEQLREFAPDRDFPAFGGSFAGEGEILR